jgi:hypothetical protein
MDSQVTLVAYRLFIPRLILDACEKQAELASWKNVAAVLS